MPTRADFYIRRGKGAEWLGSIAFDGYPEGLPQSILTAKSEKEFRANVLELLSARTDATFPENGWPWPWNSSEKSDYSYNWDGEVFYTVGYQPKRWWPALAGPERSEDDDIEHLEIASFPDMSAVKNVTYGMRSGILTTTFG